MKLKKSLWATASVIVLAYTTPVFTDDTDKVVNATGNMFMDTINKTGFFEWISGGIGYTDKTLNWDITAFSNLRETKDTVTYLQTSYNRQKSVNRLNLGLGYRKLIDTTATPLIVGVNAFFDTKDGTKNILAFKASDTFQRFSVGAELKTARFDMAANLYRRIGNNIINDKKVLHGWDITAKGSIPNYEQLSVGVGTYRFDGVEDTVVRGNKLIAEFTPNAMITVRGEYDKPNGESAQTDISVDFKLAFNKSIQDQLQSASVSATDAVWHKRYDKVERHYDIKTAEVDTTKPVGNTVQSADIQDSTGDKTVRSGDGTTQDSAYALTSGKTYAIDAFIGNVPSGVTPTVNAEIVGSGTSGTDFQFKNGSTNIGIADVKYTSTLEDKAGAGEVTLKLTYTADGFNPYEVFIKTQGNPTIGSILSDSDKASNDIKGGNGTSQATAYTLTNTKIYNVSTFVGTVPNGVTPTVKAEVVGSGTSGTDFQFKNGATNIDVTNVTYTSTLEDKAGAGEVTLKLTYTADGFNPYEVFIKTQANPTIGSVLSDSDKASNDIKGGNGSSQATAYTLTNTKIYNVSTFVGTVPNGVMPTVKAEVVGSGTSGTDFQFKNGSTNIGVSVATYTSTLEDKAGAGAATLKLTYSATNYRDRIVYVKTDSNFTGTLTMANLVVPYGSGNKTVSTADILGKLTVSGSQTQKSDWTIKSLADTDSHGNLTVNGKSLTISGAITTSTTVTVVFEHTDSEYADQTKTFELSTGAGTLGDTPTGLSGKWGKTFNVDYKLKTSDTVGDVTVSFDTSTDFTFTILPNSDGSKGGKDATTAGIVTGALSGAINTRAGAIDGSKLNKSGKLLVKIVRKAKGGLPALTDYENITVSKQDSNDHPNFRVSATGIAWATASTAVTYTEANKPTGIGTATYTLIDTGTTAGTVAGGKGTIEVALSDGKIAKTVRSGVVKVRITYIANDKYAQMSRDVDVPINKQTVAANTLSVASLVVSYVSGTKTVRAADVLGQLTATGSARSDWTVKSLAKKDTNSNFDIDSGGKSLTVKGAFTTSTTVTVVFESTKYNDVSKEFELSTRPAQVIDGTPTGLTGKWGKGTVTPDYKLDLTDQGQTFVKATDYTFSVVPSSDGGKGGKDATTAGIFSSNPISNAKTGAIDTSKLTKSGKLLIKIVRAAKGSGANAVAAATEYVNFDVTKQVLGTDVTTAPAVATATGENGAWKDSTGTKIDLDYTLPGGTRATQYTWSAAGKTGDAPSGTLNIVNGDIRGATSGGTVEITMTATPGNPKYSGSMRTADFTIGKQDLLIVNPKYASKTEAEKTANRIGNTSVRFDVDDPTATSIISVFTKAAVTSTMAQTITVSRVTGQFSSGINDANFASSAGHLSVSILSGTINGTSAQVISSIQAALRNRAAVTIVPQGPDIGFALRIKANASADKKYKAIDTTIYVVR